MVSLTGREEAVGFLSSVPTGLLPPEESEDLYKLLPSLAKDSEQVFSVGFFLARSNKAVNIKVALEVLGGFSAIRVRGVLVTVANGERKNHLKATLKFKGSTLKDFKVARMDNRKLVNELSETPHKLVGYVFYSTSNLAARSDYDFRLIPTDVRFGTMDLQTPKLGERIKGEKGSMRCLVQIKQEFAEQMKNSDRFSLVPYHEDPASCEFMYNRDIMPNTIGDQYERIEGPLIEVVNALRGIFGQNEVCCYRRSVRL